MWVFGYGSLMWRPGFSFVESCRATLQGYERAFCVRTVHHRGAPGKPGLVMGLRPGNACIGMAYRVSPENAEAVAAYLRERELDHYPVYQECRVDLLLDDQRAVAATTYLPRPEHPDFLPELSLEEQLAIIRPARGVSGSNPDYVHSAYTALLELGLEEPQIAVVAKALAAEKP